MRLWGTILVCLTSLVTASAAAGGGCGYERCWGAVGIGPDGEWAWSSGYVAESGAVARIRNDCAGCTEIKSFFNGCAVIAQADGGAWGFGWAASRGPAQTAAIRYCSHFDTTCEPAVWACSH